LRLPRPLPSWLDFPERRRQWGIPGIAVVKKTNDVDAEFPPGPYLVVGTPVTWTYEVSNTGTVTLENVTVTDDRGVSVSCPPDTLGPDRA